MNNIKTIGLAIALLSATGSALAAPNYSPSRGAYVGAELGSAEMSLNDTSQKYDSDNFRAFLGYQLNRYFAIEGGLSSMEFENELGDIADLTGIDVSMLAMLPITSKFSAYAKLGYWDWRDNTPFIENGIRYDGLTNSDFLYGIGLEYKVSSRFKLRVDATRYGEGEVDGVNGGNIDTISGSIAYRF